MKKAAYILRGISLGLSAGMIVLALMLKITVITGVLMLALGQACLALSTFKAFNREDEDKSGK